MNTSWRIPRYLLRLAVGLVLFCAGASAPAEPPPGAGTGSSESPASSDAQSLTPTGSIFSSLKQGIAQDPDHEVVRGHFDAGSPPQLHRYYCLVDLKTGKREPYGVAGQLVPRRDGMTGIKGVAVTLYRCADAEQKGLLVTAGYIVSGGASASSVSRKIIPAPPVKGAEPAADFLFVRITPADVRWQDVAGGHGVQTATLQGDPDGPGLYVIRVRFPPHVMDQPHWHPNARYVTVLEGTWYTGTGTTFDPARAVPLPAGSLMVHPARAPHWDGSASDESVVVQISGYGPGTTTQVDPKQPFWIEVGKRK
ncbi:MAG: cupin domain-containing protein [Steroidobacteraceae bacterium]